jgi:hypothetical protein
LVGLPVYSLCGYAVMPRHTHINSTPPSLQTRAGGVYSLCITSTAAPPSLQTRVGGAVFRMPCHSTPHPRFKRESVGCILHVLQQPNNGLETHLEPTTSMIYYY